MKFFAVTMTSVYLVSDDKDENNYPIVEKIALRGQSRVPVGERLKGGNLVGVTSEGIILYYEEHPSHPGEPYQDPGEVNIRFWGGHTSPIIALFLDKDEAMSCFNENNLRAGDSRWRKQTQEVLDSIGKNHPIFVVSRYYPVLVG